MECQEIKSKIIYFNIPKHNNNIFIFNKKIMNYNFFIFFFC